MRTRRFLTLALLVAAPNGAPAQIAEKVVVIRSEFGQGRAGVGTGFFISAKGRILTAYHVIQGARHITVTHHGILYPNVVIETISPDRDLATLVVGPLKRPTPFLVLAPVLPPGVEKETLTMVGHPDGNLYSSLDTRMTSPGFRQSGTIFVAGQAAVFRLPNVDMIRIAGIVNSGMSGAPVVSSRGVIGVLSGSRDEGGTLAWAIPVKYLDDPTTRVVNKRPSEVGRWEELRLMISRWKNLRHSIRLDDRLATAMHELFVAVEATRVGYELLIERIEAAIATVRLTRAFAAERASARQDFQDSDSTLVNMFGDRMTAVMAAGDQWLQARSRVASQLIEFELLLAGHQSALPSTQRNDSLLETFAPRLEALQRRLGSGDRAQHQTRDRMARDLESILPIVARASDTPAGMIPALSSLEKIFLDLASAESRLAIGAESHLIGETIALLERILTADYDEEGANWRWASGLGYELTIPAGWEQHRGSGEEAELATVAKVMNDQGYTLDRVFGRALGLAADTTSGVSMLAVGRSLVPVPRTAFESLTRGPDAEARAAGLEVERVRTPDFDTFITRGLIVRGGRRVLRCVAVIFGPARPIAVLFTLPPERHDLLPHCKAIVESATFR